ncbi:transketolase [Acholeplasma sp. OttesenSCG-928-E16]|nr:transketolase [Acholeplasma sp. OttesenSCG-928-E16]
MKLKRWKTNLMNDISKKSINALRILGVDMINNANSGHPGIVLGAAPIVATLFCKHLNIFPNQKGWINRDRFVLSAGHGSALLYAMNHFAGYNISISDLKRFRKIGNTAGHPEYGHTDGVEATTGPLGQGIADGVGMAIAETYLAAVINEDGYDIFDHYTYVLCGDGDLQEGVAMEAISLAGHLKLGKLIMLFDSNDIQLDGPVSLAFSENQRKKFEAIGWQYIVVDDGNDPKQIDSAIKKAKKCGDKPTIIEVKTAIGFGSPKEGTSSVHGSPIGSEGTKELRKNLEWDNEPFSIPQDVYEYYRKNVFVRGRKTYNRWNKQYSEFIKLFPKKMQLIDNFYNKNFKINDENIKKALEVKKISTRVASGIILNEFSKSHLNIIGGSADLTSSTKAMGYGSNYSFENRSGRNIYYGVREHAMGAIANGIQLHGGLQTFTGAFFVFSDYMKPAIRMAALMNLPTTFVFSHDSIAVGEDGPTHQPIEQLVGLRSVPNLNVIRPADAKETYGAWEIALNSIKTPTALILTRQDVKNFESTSKANVSKGAYIVEDFKDHLDGIILTCGSELEIALEAKKNLYQLGHDVRVVSMPSEFLFCQQSKDYQENVLPSGNKIVALEMGSPLSWYKYTKHVYGINSFGLSDNASVVLDKFGFTVEQFLKYYISID